MVYIMVHHRPPSPIHFAASKYRSGQSSPAINLRRYCAARADSRPTRTLREIMPRGPPPQPPRVSQRLRNLCLGRYLPASFRARAKISPPDYPPKFIILPKHPRKIHSPRFDNSSILLFVIWAWKRKGGRIDEGRFLESWINKCIPFSGVNFRSVGEIGRKELEETWGSLCGLEGEGNDEITGGRRVLERTSAHCGARAATTDAAHFASSGPHMFRISCETYPADCPRAHARDSFLFRNFSIRVESKLSVERRTTLEICNRVQSRFPLVFLSFLFFFWKTSSSFSSRIILFLS